MFRELDCTFNGAERRMGRLKVNEITETCSRHIDIATAMETEQKTFNKAISIRNAWKLQVGALFNGG